MSVHTLMRPSWRCAGCGADWPCQTRCRELLAEYVEDIVALRVSMFGLLMDALTELPGDIPPAELYLRFLGFADVPTAPAYAPPAGPPQRHSVHDWRHP